MSVEHLINEELDKNEGVLRLKPAFVARVLYPSLGRLGIKDYSVGERGWICERWMASSVSAVGPTQIKNEGLSEINVEGAKIFLRDALKLVPERMLGKNYAKSHKCKFGVLTKILDIGEPIPFHLHAREEHARKYWNMNPKEEAYYFLEHPNRGPLPYSHIGLHPDTTKEDLLPVLKKWNDDKVLDLSPAYRLNIGEGFHILPGVLHAPGTALTLEVQEESDVNSIFQAKVGERILPKDIFLLNGPKSEEEALELIDWRTCTDVSFYRKYHTIPDLIRDDNDVKEYWIFNPRRSRKFSGKKIVLSPKTELSGNERGAFLLIAWKGEGRVNGIRVVSGNPKMDEVFVSYESARDHVIVNDGSEELIIFKIFGPDVYS